MSSRIPSRHCRVSRLAVSAAFCLTSLHHHGHQGRSWYQAQAVDLALPSVLQRATLVLEAGPNMPQISGVGVGYSYLQETAQLTTLAGAQRPGFSLRNIIFESTNGRDPRVRFVKGSAMFVSSGHCGTAWALGPEVLAGSNLTNAFGARLTNRTPAIAWTSARANFSFTPLQGGTIRICYSNSGDFSSIEEAQILDAYITTFGLSDDCVGVDCIAQKTVTCHASDNWGRPNASCYLTYAGVTGRGKYAMVTRSAFATYDNISGEETFVDVPRCSDITLNSSELQLFNDTNDTSQGPYGVLKMDLTEARTQGPSTSAVCFCPFNNSSSGSCSNSSAYSQQVGTLMIFSYGICDPLMLDTCVPNPFRSVVTAGQRFGLRVFCPPKGCPGGRASRIKLVASNSTGLLPAWDRQNNCKLAPHLSGWTSQAHQCSSSGCFADVGYRQDYQIFGSNATYRLGYEPFIAGAERPDLRNGDSRSMTVDVCFCIDGLCDGTGNNSLWFKIGELQVQAVRQADISIGGLKPLSIIGVKGIISLALPLGDMVPLGLKGGGIVKLIADPNRSALSAQCASATFADQGSLFPVLGAESASEATLRIGVPAPPPNEGGLVFNGGEDSRGFIALRSGILALCYCRTASSSGACLSDSFLVAGRIPISGPILGQSWTVSLGGLFRLEYFGHGLSSSDTLRLSDSPCGLGGGAPQQNSVQAAGASARVASRCGIPGAVCRVDSVADLATSVTTESTVGCNEFGDGCDTVPIVGVVPGDGGTDLIFASDPHLSSGDEITIGNGVNGGTAGQLAGLRGVLPFAEAAGGDAASSYSVPHIVSASIDSVSVNVRRLRNLRFGFANETIPMFSVDDVGASWTRTNQGSTRSELLRYGAAGGTPLHICWRSGGAVAAGAITMDGYSAEVGTLSFVDPPSMGSVQLALVAPLSLTAVPAVLAFDTGTVAFPTLTRETALIVRFVRTDSVEIRLRSGGAILTTPVNQWTQALCGQVLLEMWSSRPLDGFPLPRRCRFRPSYVPPGKQRVDEFEMEFEPNNGLAGGTSYQLVLNIFVKDSASTTDVVKLEALNDLHMQPLSALAAIGASLSTNVGAPTNPPLGIDNALLMGLSVLDGTDSGSHLEMASSFLRIRLRLDGASSASSTSSARLRLILWPITQWSLDGDVSAALVDPSSAWPPTSVDAPLGGSSVSAVTSSLEAQIGRQVNSILVSGLGISGGLSRTLALLAPGACRGGFLAARLSAVITTTSDWSSNQYFVTSAGAELRSPQLPLAMLVTARGDGNSQPFAGATNSLYIRLVLTAGLPLTASIVLQSPPLLTGCGNASAMPNGVLLNVSQPPYGGGALRSGNWTVQITNVSSSGRICSWRHSGAAYLPGTSAFAEVTFQNPTVPSTLDGWSVLIEDSSLGIALSAPFAVPSTISLASTPVTASAYGTMVNVVDTLPFVQILPTELTVGAFHIIWIFLESSYEVGPAASVVVDAPRGFDFGLSCTALELEGEYYRYGGGGVKAMLSRLPRIVGCQTAKAGWPQGALERTSAQVSMQQELAVGVRYGFGLKVRNPAIFSTRDQALWVVKIFDGIGVQRARNIGVVALDGSAGAGLDRSWNLFDEALTPWPTVRWGDLLPFSVTFSDSFVTFQPFTVPRDITSEMRITCPIDYQWGGSLDIQWLPKAPGAKVTFPSAPTVVNNIFLVWETMTLRGGLEYGFRAPIRIPDWWNSRNIFYVEIGYRDATPYADLEVNRRPLAFVFPGPENIRILRGVNLDYFTGLVDTTQRVVLHVTLMTLLFTGEGIIIDAGYATNAMECSCVPEALVPLNLTCTAQMRPSMSMRYLFTLVATNLVFSGPLALPFKCISPKVPVKDTDWVVGTFQTPLTYPMAVPIDARAPFSGLNVQPQLRASAEVQDAFRFLLQGVPSSGADPRPAQWGSYVIAFSIGASITTIDSPSFARLRAPDGFSLPIDCLDNIVTGDVSGPGDSTVPRGCSLKMPAPHSCHSLGPVAYLEWKQPLPRGVTMCCRTIFLNPLLPPQENVWTMEVDNQSSPVIQGVVIQAFGDATIAQATRASRLPGNVNVGDPASNMLRVQFRPSVEAVSFQLVAPVGYDFGTASDCSTVRLLARMPQPTGDFTFVPRLSGCRRWANNLFLDFMPAMNSTLTPQVLYTLDAAVLNPVALLNFSSSPNFSLLSTRAQGLVGDARNLTAPMFYPSVLHYSVRNITGNASPRARVGIEIEFVFAQTLVEGNRLRVTTPFGFGFDNTDSLRPGLYIACPVAWALPSSGPAASCTCNILLGICTFVIVVPAAGVASSESIDHSSVLLAPVPAGTSLKLRVNVVAAARVRDPFVNFWEIALFPPFDPSNYASSEVPTAIGAYRSWLIDAKVSGFSVALANPSVTRAGVSDSVLNFRFMPETAAVAVRLTARTPDYWNFSNVILCDAGTTPSTSASSCQWIDWKTTSTNILDFSYELTPGAFFNKDIRGVQNAVGGGFATFQLETYASDVYGNQISADEAGPVQSFWLAGAINTDTVLARTALGFNADTDADPFFLQVPPRIENPDAFIEFLFDSTLPLEVGDWLELRSPYLTIVTLSARGTQLSFVGNDTFISITSTMVRDVLKITPNEGLLAAPARYRLRIGAVPRKPFPTGGNFLKVDIMSSRLSAPVCTNDGVVPAGTLVSVRWASSQSLDPFTISSSGSAPLAFTEISGLAPSAPAIIRVVAPRTEKTSLALIAPFGVEIMQPCLPSPCAYVVANFANTGRQAALGLQVDAGGAFKLRIFFPRSMVPGLNYWALVLPGDDGSGVAAKAWATAPSVQLRQMPASLFYSNMAGSKDAVFVIKFEPGAAAAKIGSGEGLASSVLVKAPKGYGVHCSSPEVPFQVLAFPAKGLALCNESINDTASVIISFYDVNLNQFGPLIFGLRIDVPLDPPDKSIDFFQIAMKNLLNTTIDSNVIIDGLPIISSKMKCSVSWMLANSTTFDDATEWARLCLESGVFASALALSLDVDPAYIEVEEAIVFVVGQVSRRLVEDFADQRRLLQSLPLALRLNFSVALSVAADGPRNQAALLELVRSISWTTNVTKSVSTAAANASIVPLGLESTMASSARVQGRLNTTTPLIKHLSAQPGAITTITLSWILGNDTSSIRGIFIDLPAGFQHQLSKPDDMIASELWTREEERAWVETQGPTQIRVLAALGAILKAGNYSMSFDVKLPMTMPAMNLWRFDFCSAATCAGPALPGTLVSFSILGLPFESEVEALAEKRARLVVGVARSIGGLAVLVMPIMVALVG